MTSTVSRLTELLDKYTKPNESIIWQYLKKSHIENMMNINISDAEWEKIVDYVDDTAWAGEASALAVHMVEGYYKYEAKRKPRQR